MLSTVGQPAVRRRGIVADGERRTLVIFTWVRRSATLTSLTVTERVRHS